MLPNNKFALRASALFFFMAILAITGCQMDQFENFKSFRQGKITTIEATYELPDMDTKTVRDDNAKIYWTPGDAISLFYGSGADGGSKFVAQNEAVSLKTTFAGYILAVTGGSDIEDEEDYFWGLYPYDETASCDGRTVTMRILSKQPGMDGTFAPGYAPSLGHSKGLTLSFRNIWSGFGFKVSEPGFQSVTFRGNGGEDLVGRAKIGIDENGLPYVAEILEGVKEVTLTAPTSAGFVPGVYYYMQFFPITLTDGFTVEIASATKIGKYVYSDSMVFPRSTWKRAADVDTRVPELGWEDVVNYIPGAVDLGLPSGLLWASFNVGASAPEEAGDYFAWGEVEAKEDYSWQTYKWSDDGTEYSMTKYCINEQYGTVDGKSVLERADDAASFNLGKGWRIPTENEWRELKQYASWQWTELNGVSGYMITSKVPGYTDKSIFIPAVGRMDNQVITHQGKGCYWTSTLSSENGNPINIDFDGGGCYIDDWVDGYRCFGHNVRAVYGIDNSLGADLSANGTANSYIVSAAGSYSFDASVKGNSNNPIDGVAESAEVIWESFGSSVAPAVGDIIESVDFEEGRVIFTTPEPLKDGNALIAVKNSEGTILWSWHIWVCQGFDPEASAQTYANNAGTMMDRNLGALSSTPGSDLSLGLLYQWGRKDPFMGASSLSSLDLAKATPELPAPQATTVSIQYTVEHPNQMISFSSFDWLNSTDNSRWEDTKTQYDPCPPGWKVPDGGSDGFYAKAFGTTDSFTDASLWNSSLRGVVLPASISGTEAWYPAAGSRGWSDARLVDVGNNVQIYTNLYGSGSAACVLSINNEGKVHPAATPNTSSSAYDYFHRVDSRPVRCQRETSVNPSPNPESEIITFADANFKAYCVENFDMDKDGEISRQEALLVTSIRVNQEEVASLKGIEYFTNLQSLVCYLDWNGVTTYSNYDRRFYRDGVEIFSLLSSLDVSSNTALTKLSCNCMQLTSLDVSHNTALTSLSCSYNKFTSLDLSHNTALSTLHCGHNQLTSLDVSHNPALDTLFCEDIQLTSLDVSHNTALTRLDCYNNKLTSLDLSNNPVLKTLFCFENKLMSLDFSHNTELTNLECYSNQLMSLDVSHNPALTRLGCYNNKLTSLDVSQNTALTYLNCYRNQLKSLDVSINTALKTLYCYSNQLTSLDVSNNTALSWLNCSSNPNLVEIWLKTGQTIKNFTYDTAVATIRYKD